MTKEKEISYEEALEEIKSIVEKIERGDSKVDELSAMVEKALQLINACKQKLKNTEGNIQKLFENDQKNDEL